MHSFFRGMVSIFIEESTHNDTYENIFDPQDLTRHYRQEIDNMALDKVYIATHYSNIQYTIEAYKYRSDRKYIQEYVDLLSKVIEKYGIEREDIGIVGIPMHWSRYLIRGFDHIDVLTSGLSKKIGKIKIKPVQAFFTRRQSKLSKTNRMKNREHVFGLKKGQVLPKTIILIDDIISTGSTANACAKIMKSAGVENVYGVFIASNQ